MPIATAFLSHSSSDKPFVRKVANALCQRGVVPLFNQHEGSQPEMDFAAEVNAALAAPGAAASQIESLADSIAKQVYTLLHLNNASDVNLVLDQRGKGARREPFTLPPSVAKLASHPTLVFRPDLGERSDKETLVGDAWTAFRRNIERSLSIALGSLHAEMNIHLLGNAQLGLPYLVGQYFNRLTFVSLHCYHTGTGSRFSNEDWKTLHGGKVSQQSLQQEVTLSESEKQRRRERLCNLEEQRKLLAEKLDRFEKARINEAGVAANFQLEHNIADTKAAYTALEAEMRVIETQLASGKDVQALAAGQQYDTAAIYVGFATVSDDAGDYVAAASPQIPFTPIIVGTFTTSDDVKQMVQQVLDVVQGLRKYHNTTRIQLFCALPFNVVPFLAANLVNVQVTVDYMEFRKDVKEQGGAVAGIYELLPMT